MKTASAGLTTHIGANLTTLSTGWRIERTDGTILAFTDHDKDIEYDGVVYDAETGITRSAIKSKMDLSVDNLDVQGLLSSDKISADDIRAGLYNGAEIYVFLINWNDTSQGIIRMRRGLLGQITLQNEIYVAELQGLAQLLSNEILELYTPECQADFGDTRCGFDTSVFLQSSEVLSVTDARRSFTVQESIGSGSPGIDFSLSGLPGYNYKYGRLEWTSGLNNGVVQEVKAVSTGTAALTLYLKAPFTIQAGDTFEITAGCDKRFVTCKFFSNQKNFRGFPDIPGQDRYLDYPDARA